MTPYIYNVHRMHLFAFRLSFLLSGNFYGHRRMNLEPVARSWCYTLSLLPYSISPNFSSRQTYNLFLTMMDFGDYLCSNKSYVNYAI